MGFASSKRHDPEMRFPGVLGKRNINCGECDPASVGGDSEVSYPLEVHHVIKGEETLLGVNRQRADQDDCYEQAA